MIIFLIPSFLLHLLVGILLFRDITSYFIFVYLFLAVVDLRCCTWVSPVVASRGYSPLQCVGPRLQWLLLLQSAGSRHTGFRRCCSQALEPGLSSCGAWGLVAPRHAESSWTRD